MTDLFVVALFFKGQTTKESFFSGVRPTAPSLHRHFNERRHSARPMRRLMEIMVSWGAYEDVTRSAVGAYKGEISPRHLPINFSQSYCLRLSGSLDTSVPHRSV